MVFNNARLRPVVVFKIQGFRNAIVYSRYLRCFCDRPIYPSFTISPSAFSKYDMNIPALGAGLGWESLTEDQRFIHCPKAVRLFYVNIRRDHGAEPRSFTTMVYDHEITVTPDLLASVYLFFTRGIQASFDSDFAEQGFDFCQALDHLTCDIGKASPTRLSAGHLPDDLKVLHFFITRYFLPCDASSAGLLHSSDLWIMENARVHQPISFASLMYAHILRFGIDLRDKVAVCRVHDDLRPNHVLVRLDADVGRLAAIDGEVKRRKETGSGKTTSLLVCKECLELMEDGEARPAPDDFDPITPESSSDDDISDYESLPSYPF
ncbi:unnamed protein product [Linum trigynum]|uniref:Uncharacterized protein n=1 Tax=Linum trigynum TaxID=586398 RepID=A0AAV2F9S7_9ROSI